MVGPIQGEEASPAPLTNLEPNAPHRPRIPRRELLALLVLVAVYTAVLTYLSQVRFNDLYDAAWDLGLNQQMLWTTAHGYLLYETPDRLQGGGQTFLLVHTTYVAFLAVPLYAAWPHPVTLFALGAAAVAAAAIPLFLLLRRAVPSAYLSFLLTALFLVNCAAVSALLASYHWEAFLPAEFLWTFWLWSERRFYYALVPAVLGMLTLEVFPFLLLGLVLYGAIPWLRLFVRSPLGALRKLRDSWVEARPWVGLGVLALGGAFVLQLLADDVWAPLYGQASTGISGAATGGFTRYLSVGASGTSLEVSLFFWFLLLATMGFLPLFSPRGLVLSLPWFIGSVVVLPYYSSGFGNQYAFVALATLSVGMAEGAAALFRRPKDAEGSALSLAALALVAGVLAVLALGYSPELLSAAIALGYSPIPLSGLALPLLWTALTVPVVAALAVFFVSSRAPQSSLSDPRRTARHPTFRIARFQRPIGILAVSLLIAFNLLLAPVNSVNYGATGQPGYQVVFGTNPVLGPAEWLAGLVPPNAVVMATQNLFPFVANDPNAWPSAVSLYPSNPGFVYEPFNASHLPTYVLTDAVDWSSFPPGVQWALLNRSTYGLVGYVVYQGVWPGSVYLFELGYRGTPQVRWASAPWPPYLASADNLTLGPSGTSVPNANSKFGSVIESQASSSVSENQSEVWADQWHELPNALYELTFNLSGTSNLSATEPNATVLQLYVGPYADPPPWLSMTITAGDLDSVGWSDFSYTIPLVDPYAILDLQGYLGYDGDEPNGSIALNYIELAPLGSPSAPG